MVTSSTSPSKRAAEPDVAILRDALSAVSLRVRVGLLVTELGLTIGGLALTLGGALLAMRLLAIPTPVPSPWWLVSLAPVAVLAIHRTQSRYPGNDACALYLDRKLGLGGLLIAGLERDAKAWEPALKRGLGGLSAALPQVHVGPTALLVLPALMFLGVVLKLPPVLAGVGAPRSEAVAAAVEDLSREIERLKATEKLSLADLQDLEERAAKLADALDAGKTPTWSDIDALEDRLAQLMAERGTVEQKAGLGLAALSAAMEALAAGGSPTPEAAMEALAKAMAGGQLPGLDPADLARMADAFNDAGAAAGLGGIPPELAQALAQAGFGKKAGADGPKRPGGKKGLGPEDAARMAALAKQLAALRGSPEAQKALAALRAQLPKDFNWDEARKKHEREGNCPACGGKVVALPKDGTKPGQGGKPGQEGKPGQGGKPGQNGGQGEPTHMCSGCGAELCEGTIPGRGGITRGPGSAALSGRDGELPTTGPEGGPLELPEGASPQRGGELIEVTIDEPEVNPDRDTSVGGQGTADRDVVGAGRRTLAPRQREAVRRFFEGTK